MSISPILRPRILVMFALALILSVSAYGFAAANTVALTSAGDGSTAITGYDISSVAYTLDGNSPNHITSVAFTVTPLNSGLTAASAKIRLFAGDTYHPCVLVAATLPAKTATCSLTDVAAEGVLTSSANSLIVLAWS